MSAETLERMLTDGWTPEQVRSVVLTLLRIEALPRKWLRDSNRIAQEHAGDEYERGRAVGILNASAELEEALYGR